MTYNTELFGAFNLQKSINALSAAKESIYEEAAKLAYGVNPSLAEEAYKKADQIIEIINALKELEFAAKPDPVDVSKFDLDDLSIAND